jgi:AcrR family transcriptional regulator
MAVETYEKILAAAKQLFVKQGYTATSMRQIAEKANIGKATIYHHFPDKEAVVMALLDQNTSRMNEVLEQVRIETAPRQRIQIAVQSSINFLYEYADIMQIVRREVPGVRDQTKNGFSHFFKEYMTLIAEAIQKGVEQGIFRSIDPTDAAHVLMTMIQGTFATAYLTSDRSIMADHASSTLLDVYFNGLDKR